MKLTKAVFFLFTVHCSLLTLLGCGDPFDRGEEAAAVNVEPGKEYSYAKDVYPVLQSGCACHAGSGIGAFAVSGNAAADYDKIKGLVNPDSPADSTLYQKGAGKTSHGGGAALGGNADAVLAWITQGAANN